jgi:hypothetical protein
VQPSLSLPQLFNPTIQPGLFLYDTGTINLSISGAQPELYASNTIVFPVPAFSGTVNVLVPGTPPVVGKKAMTLLTPLATTFAYRCVESPLLWWMRMVVVVETVPVPVISLEMERIE